MTREPITRIDVDQILKLKAPAYANKIPGFLINYLKRIIHQDEINNILLTYRDKEGVDFMQELIGYFNLKIELINEENIPTEGRYIFASNHPLGGLDGICLAAIVGEKFQGNIRYLVNDLLLNIPNLKNIFVPINKFGKQQRETAKLIEESYCSDNQIITFPAGLCSRKQKGKIRDLDWQKSFIQKAISHERDIIPVYFDGRNSNFFYTLANLRKSLGIKMNYELIYLPDEMFRCKHPHFRIIFGKPISWKTFDKSKTHAEWAEWVKNIVYNEYKP